MHTHPDSRVVELLKHCPFLIGRVDLSEHAYYIMGEVATAIQEATLSEEEIACVFAYFEEMAKGDTLTQNLLMVGALEILTDTPESVTRTRERLGTGPARLPFEQMMKFWYGRGRDPRPW